MNRIQPFRGWRYDLAAAGAQSLNEVLTPPYDVISPEEQRAYYERHPHNVIRAVLTQTEPTDDDHHNRYTRAAAVLAQWRAAGILRPEPAPAIYLLRERFKLPDGRLAARTGLIARLRLAAWGEGILPHERTFPAAKADRLALTIATRCQFSPIYTLYSDAANEVLSPLLAAAEAPPDASLNDGQDSERLLWAVTDRSALQAAVAALSERTLYVADGHHRWETALNYQRLRRGGSLPDSPPPPPLSAWAAITGYREYPEPGPPTSQPYDYALIYAARIEDPGVVILPTHRCLQNVAGFDGRRLLAGLQKRFQVQAFDDDEALVGALRQARSGDHAYALVLPEGPGFLLRLRPDPETLAQLHRADHPAVAVIDVAALQTLVLEPLLGIGREAGQQKRHLVTLPDTQAAIAETRSGGFQAAFLVNPTTLEQLRNVSDAGQVTPPKATYFSPKLPSGLVINYMA